MATRIKICGVRTPAIAACASDAGADAIGLVFYPPSVRAVSVEQAETVIQATAPLVTVVGLFVDPTVEEVSKVLESCAIDCLQFHGNESAEFCEQFRRPYLKAIAMRPDVDVAASVKAHPRARAYLFDAWSASMPGGTGKTFVWERLPALEQPWLLAGGLDAGNIESAIVKVRPSAVDVSGGVECRPGEKCPDLLKEFIGVVRRADQVLAECDLDNRHGRRP
ncbi:MAG: phosphoribosylanthranilate isomerase [Congregibacter sp.]